MKFLILPKSIRTIEQVDVPERTRTVSPPLSGEKLVTFEHDSIRQPLYQRLYRAPSYRQSKEDALALQVLQDIFGSGSTSRLYKSLVIEDKLATSVGLSYRSAAWDDASISVYASPAPNVDMEEIEAAIDAEIDKLVSEGVTEEELQDSLNRMQAEAIYARDSLTGAMVIGYSLVTGSSLDDIEYWPQNIAKVTAAQIQSVAAKYLDTDSAEARFVSGHLLPAQAEAEAVPEASEGEE